MSDSFTYESEMIIDDSTSKTTILFKGALDRYTSYDIFEKLTPLLKKKQPLTLDLNGVTSIDSAGVALLADTMKKLGAGPNGCSLQSVNDDVAKRLNLAGWDFQSSGPALSKRNPKVIESVGENVAVAGRGIFYFAFLVSEIFYLGIIGPFKGERPRYQLFFDQMAKIGAGSAPIVLLVAMLVGLTTAFQSAYELRQFGANIYVADLVAISMMIELGPLMAAILVAGRSGAAITAEIGTMQVTEEIDAMRLIGIKPIQYLAVPRVYAAIITQPLLGVMAAMVGIIGGLIIGVYYLDLSVTAFVTEAISSLTVGDLFHNISKSMVFGVIIVTTGVYYGLKVTGGAEGVGRATTNSVVTSIFLIILADCAFSFT